MVLNPGKEAPTRPGLCLAPGLSRMTGHAYRLESGSPNPITLPHVCLPSTACAGRTSQRHGRLLDLSCPDVRAQPSVGVSRRKPSSAATSQQPRPHSGHYWPFWPLPQGWASLLG